VFYKNLKKKPEKAEAGESSIAKITGGTRGGGSGMVEGHFLNTKRCCFFYLCLVNLLAKQGTTSSAEGLLLLD